MRPNAQETTDLVTSAEEEILNRKLHFLCSDSLTFEQYLRAGMRKQLKIWLRLCSIKCKSKMKFIAA